MVFGEISEINISSHYQEMKININDISTVESVVTVEIHVGHT
jgi:hypothetical protein